MHKILNVIFDERFGGPPSRVLQVAERLRPLGFETVVVIPKGDPIFGSFLKAGGIEYFEFDLVRLRNSLDPRIQAKFATRFWGNITTLRRLMRHYDVDIVHTNGLMNLQAAFAARLEGIPLIWHLNDISTPGPLRLLFAPLIRRWATRIAAAANAVARVYFSDLRSIKERLHILYAPVNTARFSPEVSGCSIRQEFGIPETSPLISVLCNLHPGKGIEFFLEAAPAIKAHSPETKFMVIGDRLKNRRAYWTALLRRTQELGLAQDFIFTGRRNDTPQLLAASTVYVHPSEKEACPMAVLEASASGVPVVATDVGGTRELVEHGVTGWLVESRSPARISEAVIRLLADPERARTAGRLGAERMALYFSVEKCVEEHLRMYYAALRSSPAGNVSDPLTDSGAPRQTPPGAARK